MEKVFPDVVMKQTAVPVTYDYRFGDEEEPETVSGEFRGYACVIEEERKDYCYSAYTTVTLIGNLYFAGNHTALETPKSFKTRYSLTDCGGIDSRIKEAVKEFVTDNECQIENFLEDNRELFVKETVLQ